MPLAAGTRLGPYEILSPLGSGGMGEVYRARDRKLDRDVAIKILPEAFALDADRIARFDREAKTLAALNHPNIAHIHGLEESDGIRALVMELVDGPTLADRIARGPIPLDEALPIAKQIAEGLEAAHEQGIIHRDLKPANIKLRPDGTVKLLDFGLAKVATTSRSSDVTNSPTLTSPAMMTGVGVLLGTAAYMSPEQARGKPIDRRTDIWAFGCVLYEMLSGRRAFSGETLSDVIASILDHEPEWTALPRDVPASVRRLLEQSLVKDPKRRLRDIGQAWVELDAASTGRIASPAPMLPAPTHSRRRLAIPAALLVLLVAALTAFTWSQLATLSTPAAGPATFTQLTDVPGPELYPSLSPNGMSFVYQSRAAGKWDIYSQRVGGRNAVNLTAGSTDDNTQPTFSPDGQHIAFRSERDGGGIFVMGATGEDVKRLTDLCYNPAWSPDGKEIVCSTGSFTRPEETLGGHMVRVNTSTGDKQPIPGAIRESLQPHWSPHGSRIAYWARQTTMSRDLFTVSTSGGDPVPVTGDAFVDWNPTWSPDGRYLYFSSDRGGSMNLWRVRIDEQSGKTLAPPEPVTTPAQSSGFISFSRDGLHMAYGQLTRTWNLYKAVFDPSREAVIGQPVPVTQGSKEVAFSGVSPDGEWIAFTTRLKPEDVFIVKADGTGLRQLTNDIDQDRVPRWSPDGKRIAVFSDRSGKSQIWTINSDGSGLQQLTDVPAGAWMPIWSPDGSRLFCMGLDGKGYIMDAGKRWSEQSPQILSFPVEGGARLLPQSWSADGRRLVGPFLRREDGGPVGIGAYSLDSHTYERLSPVGGLGGYLLNDNRHVLFPRQGKLFLVDSHSKNMHEVLSVAPYEAVQTSFGFSRDARLITFVRDATEADVWLMK